MFFDPGPRGSGGPAGGPPPSPSWALPGPPGASRRPPGPKTNEGKKSGNLKKLIEQWSSQLWFKRDSPLNSGPRGPALTPPSNLVALSLGGYPMLRNNASGPESGLPAWISDGFSSGKPQTRPSGRPKAGRRADLKVLSFRIWPKSGPEAQSSARKHYCVTKDNSGSRGIPS